MNVSTEEMLVREVAEPLYQARFWMKLAGVLMIISGGLTALTIVGILFAWLPIWLGVLLFQAASSAELARSSGESASLTQSADKLRLYFTITGVVMLVSLILAVGGMLLGGMAMIGMLLEMAQQAGG